MADMLEAILPYLGGLVLPVILTLTCSLLPTSTFDYRPVPSVVVNQPPSYFKIDPATGIPVFAFRLFGPFIEGGYRSRSLRDASIPPVTVSARGHCKSKSPLEVA
jgi:hypothetical protein